MWIVLLVPELVIDHVSLQVLDRELLFGLLVDSRPRERLHVTDFRMGELLYLDLPLP